MRENCTYGSEGGEAKSLPYPYRAEVIRSTVEAGVVRVLAPVSTGKSEGQGRRTWLYRNGVSARRPVFVN